MTAQLSKKLVIFFFNDTATTEIYTLSLHDALPISPRRPSGSRRGRARAAPSPPAARAARAWRDGCGSARGAPARSEEHTSELQSRQYLVCRLLLEKKKHQEVKTQSLLIYLHGWRVS